MKKILLLALLLVICSDAFAQSETTTTKPDRVFYIGIGGGPASGKQSSVFSFLGNAVLTRNGYGLTISLTRYFNEKAKFLPSDYRPDDMLFGVDIPNDRADIYSLRLFQEFRFRRRNGTRAGWEIGPSWVVYKEAQFTKRDIIFYLGPAVSNYKVSYIESQGIGLSMRGKIAFTSPTALGVEIGAFTNINRYQSIVGADLHFLFGYFGRYKKK